MASSRTIQTALRLTPDIYKRTDALQSKMAKDKTLDTLGEVTRTTVLKLAVLRGLEVLEREYKVK